MTVTNRPNRSEKNGKKFLNFWTEESGRIRSSDATVEERRGRWQCRAEARTWALPDAVRATKKSSTSVASGTTAEKGAADKNKATTNRNLALKGKKAMLCAQPRHTLTRCGIHFRSTQMGQCNGFRSRLWQLVRIFTARLVMEK
jgi:hypothetical protein